MIEITAKTAGFRRCGIAHPLQATLYPVDHFTPEQLATLKAEPQLVVIERADPPAEKSKAAKGKETAS